MFDDYVLAVLISYWFGDLVLNFCEFSRLRLVNKTWLEMLTRAFIADVRNRGQFLQKYIEADTGFDKEDQYNITSKSSRLSIFYVICLARYYTPGVNVSTDMCHAYKYTHGGIYKLECANKLHVYYLCSKSSIDVAKKYINDQLSTFVSEDVALKCICKCIREMYLSTLPKKRFEVVDECCEIYFSTVVKIMEKEMVDATPEDFKELCTTFERNFRERSNLDEFVMMCCNLPKHMKNKLMKTYKSHRGIEEIFAFAMNELNCPYNRVGYML